MPVSFPVAPPTFARTQTGASPDAMFGYLSSALDQNLNYIVLPRQINLGDPGEASRYAKVSFTNTDGTTLTGAPIADSVTVLERSAQRQTAVDFVRLLVSEQGRAFVQSRDFLAGPVLVAGDVSALPGELAPFVEGCFERSHCELGSRQNAN
jgi:molybdate/tungstate transport system substrate-binding protein